MFLPIVLMGRTSGIVRSRHCCERSEDFPDLCHDCASGDAYDGHKG